MRRYRAIGLWLIVGVLVPVVQAQQARTVSDGVFSEAQAGQGQALYKERCAGCHGASMEGGAGPALTGAEFLRVWSAQPLLDFVSKIQNTMPANDPGKLTRPQATALAAHVLRTAKFPAGRSELSAEDAALQQIAFPTAAAASKPAAAASAPASQAFGNMAQVMRGILFPSSNLIFAVQGQDPAAPREAYKPGAGGFNWADWGAGIYSGWELVDYAAVTMVDVTPLLLLPRRCENGKPAPVERADWVKYVQELADAGRAVYKASQTRNQEAVSDATNNLSDACLNCHVVYRDKPGGSPADPSNKAARCTP